MTNYDEIGTWVLTKLQELALERLEPLHELENICVSVGPATDGMLAIGVLYRKRPLLTIESVSLEADEAHLLALVRDLSEALRPAIVRAALEE